jgi:hypothetical protein
MEPTGTAWLDLDSRFVRQAAGQRCDAVQTSSRVRPIVTQLRLRDQTASLSSTRRQRRVDMRSQKQVPAHVQTR